MADMNDIMNDDVVDTTKGKITEPYVGKNNPFEDVPKDVNFETAGVDETEIKDHSQIVPKHAPVIDENPGDATEGTQPVFKAVKRPINPVNKNDAKPPEMTEFDISSLPKKEVHNEAAEKFEKRLMDDLDIAVEREKQSITKRTQDILQAQKEEAEDLYRRGIITKNDEVAVDKDIEGYDNNQVIIENAEVANVEPKKVIYTDNPSTDETPVQHDIDDDLGDYADTDEENKVVATQAPADMSVDSPNTKFSDEELDADLAKEIGEPIEESQEDAAHRLGNEVRVRTLPYKNKINLSDFEVDDNNKVINIEDHLSISNLSTADWVLPNANRVGIFSALSGPEMLALNPNRSGQNRVNTMRKIYNIIYQHIVSEKPASFDEWLKTTRFNDLDHYYFGVFKATFTGSNFMNYNCDNCGHTFIHDLSFDDYVRYTDDETKEKMTALLRSGDTSIAPYDIHRCQIDDNYVMDLRNPSIQDTILDVAGLSEQFVSKYEDLMDVLVYIDNVYKINYDTHKLELIDLKVDHNNHTKTVARRISILNKILNRISTDAYYELRRNMVINFPNMNSISFQIPACKCEKCGAMIPARTDGIEAQTLLFMRHQLGAFVIL